MVPTLGGGGTQDTDFNKKFTKGMFTKNLRRRNGGCQGDPDPLMSKLLLGLVQGKVVHGFIYGTPHNFCKFSLGINKVSKV